VIGVSVLIRLSFITTLPVGSDDVYRYLWDGKVQTSNINPYRYAPNAPELSHLHSQLLPASVNHIEMKTLYFPLSQWAFIVAYQMSGENFWGFKLLLLAAELATGFGLYLVLKKLAIPLKFLLIYALCPLPIIEFALDAHLDGLGLPLFIIALFFFLDRKQFLSYVFLGLAISIKPVALVVLPVLLFHEAGLWNRVKIVLVPTGIVAVQFLPYVFTSNPFEGLFTFAQNWTFNGPVFEILFSFINDNQTARIICALLLGAVLLTISLGKKDLIGKIYLSVLFLLLFSPVVHPWYVAWMVVLLPIVRQWSGITFAATASLTCYTLLQYKLAGFWVQSPIVLILEYLPVLVLLSWELLREYRERTYSHNPI
jgi:alpha-1,6-mannosyltransferase